MAAFRLCKVLGTCPEMKRKIFVLHLWREQLDQDRVVWRGRITKVETGEVRFFRDSASFYRVLLLMLSDAQEQDENN